MKTPAPPIKPPLVLRERWTFVGRMENGRYLWKQQYGGACWRDVDTFWKRTAS